ncbi:hypothetical protein BSKO_06097 [Bryopsis sp. KO-2023]|nr:hypothetical protein BSKO_06097 [Bryopsis sp. KO-2023]
MVVGACHSRSTQATMRTTGLASVSARRVAMFDRIPTRRVDSRAAGWRGYNCGVGFGRVGSSVARRRFRLGCADKKLLTELKGNDAKLRAALNEPESEHVDRLSKENAALREKFKERLEQMSQQDRSKFLAENKELVQIGREFGVEVPSSETQASSSKTEEKPEASGNEVVFAFEPEQKEKETTAPSVAHNATAVQGLTTGSPSGRFHVGVYSFSTSTVEEAGGSGVDAGKDEVKQAEERQRKQEAEAKAKQNDEEAKRRAVSAAKAELDGHDPVKAVAEKSHWLYFMVPETPVAGVNAMVYFNRSVSDVLRHRPHVQMHAGFNDWELECKPAMLNLAQAPVSRDDGSDWWRVEFDVPEESYEMNFIFSDGEGCFDNNYGQDFLSEVVGGLTKEEWASCSATREKEALEARLEAEKKAKAEAEIQRREQLKQQDIDAANWRIGEMKGEFENWRKGAVKSLDYDGRVGWKTVPENLVPGQPAKLLYNAKVGPLAWITYEGDAAPTVKYGHNSWKSPKECVMRRVPIAAPSYDTDAEGDAERKKESFPKPKDDDDWWEGDLNVPVDALVLNFVIQFYDNFDNNNRMDHKIVVGPPKLPPDSWFTDMTELFRLEEETQRLENEAKEAERLAKREKVRMAAREKTMAVARRQIKHVLFTDPPVIKAGEKVDIYYSSNNTCLNGKEQIYINGGWNRWTHKKPFGPLKMTPPSDGDHWKASVKVPIDAYKMDFVFSDVEGGDGVYDNRGGFDYHIPVEGGVAEESSLHVVHVAVEMAPIAKVGGLGDVVTALGRAVKEQGHLVEVIVPRYDFFLQSPVLNDVRYETEFEWGGTRIYVTTQIVEDLRVFFIEPRNGFFNTQSVYGRYDDAMRFEFFCKAAMEFLLQSGRQPDILHCHDWSTADVARVYWDDYHHFGLWKPKVVFTIHNLNYGQTKIGEAARHSQKFTTVSPTYAMEVGGHPAVAPHREKFMGIRNGIDMDLWDPETDQFLPMGFTASNVVEGKRAARLALAGRLGVDGAKDAPMVGVVSRLTGQKGVHLIKHAAWKTVDRGGIFILLGSAPDPEIQGEFNTLAEQMHGQYTAFHFAYDEPLSHLVYAACDFILVPSIFEPCGLTQMIAMRYGAVPIVRSTGGLHDTVFDVEFDKPRAAWEMEGSSDWQRDGVDETNGFAFQGTDTGGLDYAMNRAIDSFWNDRQWFHGLQKRVMLQDWSWNRPALDYIELYYATLKT